MACCLAEARLSNQVRLTLLASSTSRTPIANVLSASRPVAMSPSQCRSLDAACLAHALRDGYTDVRYPFLPVWQAQFGLSSAAPGMLRALNYRTVSSLQVPGARLVHALSPRAALVPPTIIAATGFVVMAVRFGLPHSTALRWPEQHPASSIPAARCLS